jgi:hypothetical protein
VVKKSPAFKGPEVSLPRSEESAIELYSEPFESSPYLHTSFRPI